MRVHTFMSSKVITVSPGTPVAEARDLFRTNGIEHLVVTEQKNVVGVLSAHDLLKAEPDDVVGDVMSREVSTIAPSETLRHAAAQMSGSAVGCLPVVEDGTLLGIITTADILRMLAKGATHLSTPSERYTLRKRAPRPHHPPNR